MKKIACLVSLILLGSSMVSKAEIQLSFYTGASSGALLDHTGSSLVGDSLFLVFWSLDSVADFNAANPLAPLNGDILLDQTTTADPNYWSQDGGIIGGNVYYGAGSAIYAPTGHVYIAAFELPYASYTGVIPGGTYYGIGPVTTLPLTQNFGVAPPAPDDYGALLVATPLQTSLQTTVVPEPTTMALFGLGAVILAARKRKSRRT